MVDLNCVPCAKPPPAAIEELSQPLSNQAKQLCRLCLREDDAEPDKVVNIFQEPDEDTQGKETKAIKDLLYELFSIKVSGEVIGINFTLIPVFLLV